MTAPNPTSPTAEVVAFDAARRAALLGEMRALDPDDQLYGRRILPLLVRYAAELPRVRLSRCPFTAEVLQHSVDTFGLDGPWWEYEVPTRPDEVTPDSFYALTGAMRLASRVEHTDVIVRPGPGVPFVVPWMLEHPMIKAVVSTVPVGGHTGYVVAYFADDPAPLLRRFNTWGRSSYSFRAGSQKAWSVAPEGEEFVDYDLGRWIDEGKLSWIAPGDTTLSLRDGTDGCPYLDLTGSRNFASIRYGQVFPSGTSRTGEAATPPGRRSRTRRSRPSR